jgi:hypothetical protein
LMLVVKALAEVVQGNGFGRAVAGEERKRSVV